MNSREKLIMSTITIKLINKGIEQAEKIAEKRWKFNIIYQNHNNNNTFNNAYNNKIEQKPSIQFSFIVFYS